MNFLPLLLVVLTFATGLIWLIDRLAFAPGRRRRASEIEATVALSESERKARLQEALREPVVTEYARSFFPVLALILVFRSFIAEPFKIPSGSMMPTLLVGDFILVNKFSYGLRLPVLNTRILDLGSPQRGDVFVFRYPGYQCERGGKLVRSGNPCFQPYAPPPEQDYIKRVIGLPGDEITYRNKVLYVNGVEVEQSYVGPYTGPSEPGRNFAGAQVKDEKLGEVEHRMMTLATDSGTPEGTWRVPEGHYFAMGDNRDASADSRVWGMVPEENLVGRAFVVWMSCSGRFCTEGIDFSRIGTVIK
ncbi:signal peptidase I [Dokdonella sp.]|uniref:signal peptidase I n=1 Tax=Dokdonella sp. TaxID=2291710 RepID=UPI0025C6603D|nr:signal peptidase I [Dokdonella sp.]MBX3693258.1 signal peptidase I [Dokdonella sp.]MCW5567764.1 signal peptidase I [Dokdonella sp.]